jgi:hypothetical protein
MDIGVLGGIEGVSLGLVAISRLDVLEFRGGIDRLAVLLSADQRYFCVGIAAETHAV